MGSRHTTIPSAEGGTHKRPFRPAPFFSSMSTSSVSLVFNRTGFLQPTYAARALSSVRIVVCVPSEHAQARLGDPSSQWTVHTSEPRAAHPVVRLCRRALLARLA